MSPTAEGLLLLQVQITALLGVLLSNGLTTLEAYNRLCDEAEKTLREGVSK